MTQQIYTSVRRSHYVPAVFESVVDEFYPLFVEARKLIDDEFDKLENYKFDDAGIKVLTADSKPYRMIEKVRLLVHNDVVVGHVILRGRNEKPKHGHLMLLDFYERSYELRFKTFSGCINTVESAGLAMTQTGRGPTRINTGNSANTEIEFLKRHWDQFKDQLKFTAADLDLPTRKQLWSENTIIYARS